MSADFLNMIRREIDRAIARAIQPPRHGLISAYNPATASVKISFPEDLDENGNPKQTGWIPWHAGSAGGGWTATFAPVLGMQATLNFSGGDGNSGYATGGLHSQSQPPAGVPEGEMWLLHQNGVCLKVSGDGHVYAGTKSGTFQRLATEQFVLNVYNSHSHPYQPGSGSTTQTGAPQQQVSSSSTTDLTAQLKAT